MNRAQTAVIYVRLKQVMETGEGLTNQTGTSEETVSGTLTNGKPVTEENVLALLEEYKNGTRLPGEKARAAGFTSYISGATYDPNVLPYQLQCLGRSGRECAKFAFAFWDDLFGDLPAREFTGHPEDVRPGDILHFERHWAIATQKAFIDWAGSLSTTVVDGGATGSIMWSTEGSTNFIGEDRLIGIYTRYPE